MYHNFFADKMPWIFVILLTSAAVTVQIVNGARDSHEAKKECGNDCSCVSNSSIDDYLRNLTNDLVLCFANHSKWYEVTEFFIIADLRNIIIRGPSHITCKKGVGLVFYNISNFRFQNVTIKQCGLRLTEDRLNNITSKFQTSPYHFQPNITVGVFLIHSTNVIFQEVSITETQGIGLVCVNAVGQLEFSDVVFQYNQPADIEECKYCLFPYNASANCIFNPESVSGSVLLLYLKSVDQEGETTSVNITGAEFIDNFSCSMISLADVQPIYTFPDKSSRNIPTTAGIEVILAQSNYPVDIMIDSSIFANNTGLVGSGLNVGIFESARSCKVLIQDCSFSNNGQLKFFLPDSLPSYGGAVSIIPYMPSVDHSSHAVHSLDISNCSFDNNIATIGGAVFIPNIQAMFDESAKLDINISACNFINNTGVLGHGIYISGLDNFSNKPSLTITQCNISNNEVNDLYNGLSNPESYGVIYLSQITASVSDTVFINNTGTAINLAFSSLLMKGNVYFANNNAISGGALYLHYYSTLVFCNNSRIQFINNAASTVGGAIYYDHKFNPAGNSFTNCFIYFNTFDPFCTLKNTCYSEEMNITVNFTDNKAGYGSTGYGSAIYGAGLYCPWLVKNGTNFSVIDITYVLSEDFSDVLIFSPNVTSEYVIATASRDIHASIYNLDIMPGQIATVYLNATDHYGRPAIDTVAASMISRQFKGVKNSSADVLTSGYQLLQGGSLTPTEIQINGTENRNTSLVIYSLYAGAQLRIPVQTTSCWFGFVYDTTQHACLCDPHLVNTGVTCNYLNGYLRKPRKKWIGMLENDIVVLSCVYDFCADVELVDPRNLEDQCNYQRGGVLCGGCRHGYYAKTGHSGCEHCKGVGNLLFLIFFTLLIGAWLVFATAFLRIYISDGYIYPMFFYVNIIYLFKDEIFHDTYQSGYIYATFNLRGIYNFCVYKNMDFLALAGLDFVFPLYLCLIIISLTVIAKCRGPYRKNRFGYSTTKVFATLLYICYSLLVDFSFHILSFTVIKAPSGKEIRWRLDPHVHYFKGIHGFLGTVSILCLLILFAVALTLLFPKQGYQFRIVQRLKPLIDAFQAPFKIRYSFWIGLRLVLRICLHIIANTVPDQYQLYIVGCILCLLLYAQAVCLPYTDSKTNALDNFFIILLIMQFIEALSKTEIAVISTVSIYLFFLIYLISVVLRICNRFPKIYKLLALAREKLWSLVSRSHRGGYTEINSFAEDKMPVMTEQEPFETSVRTDYASVPTTTIPDIPEPMDYTRFRESVLEVINDGN